MLGLTCCAVAQKSCSSCCETTSKEMKVPTTFNEMLLFNASVMGYGSSTWMSIVLQQFDDMAA